MNIVHIVPGSGGGFYCQNCVRDIGLVKALHTAGHEVLFVPLYLPFMEMADECTIAQAPVFYGAVNVYLEQKLPLYRRLPSAWRRLFDAPGLLRWAAGKAGTTQADGLGDLTLSVLEGREGRQRRELDQLIDWLQTQPRPDMIHLSNALLLGLAPALREALGAPIACTLQDEDTWIDVLPSPYRERCWTQMRQRCQAVDLFIPVSASYTEKIKPRLDLPAAKCRTIPIGIDLAAFSPATAPPALPVIGYLSELTPPYGLHILVEAFLKLKGSPDLAALRLRVTGGDVTSPTPYLRDLQRRIAAAGYADDVEFCNAYRQPQRSAFLRSLSVLSVPAVRPEAFGLFQIEAMASGVPVVQPRLGGYPEIVAATGGGVIYDDNTPDGLAGALRPLLEDTQYARRFGMTGRAAVETHFSVERMADNIVRAYREIALAGRSVPLQPR